MEQYQSAISDLNWLKTAMHGQLFSSNLIREVYAVNGQVRNVYLIIIRKGNLYSEFKL